MRISISWLAGLSFCGLLLATPVQAESAAAAANSLLSGEVAKFEEKPATVELLNQIRHGGFVLYLRHGYTDNRHPDRTPSVDLNDCSTQRQLSDEGRKLMRQVGEAMRKAHIPVGEVLASPMCRTKESAELAVGRNFSITEPLMYTRGFNFEVQRLT